MRKRLVDNGIPKYGMYSGVDLLPNLLESKLIWNRKTPRFFKNFRLKEWEAFQLWAPDYFVFGAVYDAKVTGIVLLSVYKISTGELLHYSKKVLPSKLNVGKHLSDSISKYSGRNPWLEIINKKEKFEISSKAKNIDLKIMAERKSNSLTVCLPLGKNRSMYSHKCLLPISGTLNIDGQRTSLNSENSQLIIDHHKGFYPYKLSYDWVTASWRENGILYGFNFTRNQVLNPDKYNENCIWIGDDIFLLPAITFEVYKNYWQIKSKCGKVDIRFLPKRDNPIKFNALVIAVNYRAPYGYFEGNIEANSKTFSVKNAFGMGEIKRYRM